MIATSIVWILVASGGVTAIGGLAAFLAPQPLLRLVFGVEPAPGSIVFFVRHWGILLLAIGALIAYSAFAPVTRVPILTAAIVEKVTAVLLIFFGPLKRTVPMTAVAVTDGAFSIAYAAYLAGL